LPAAMLAEEKALYQVRGPIISEAKILEIPEVMETVGPDKRYTGEKIALDFFETDIKNVFRILREVSGKTLQSIGMLPEP
jgi:hypothetical protein